MKNLKKPNYFHIYCTLAQLIQYEIITASEGYSLTTARACFFLPHALKWQMTLFYSCLIFGQGSPWINSLVFAIEFWCLRFVHDR